VGGEVETRNELEQRRLPATGRADNRNEFAFVDAERCPFKGERAFDRSALIDDADVGDIDKWEDVVDELALGLLG